MDIPSRSENHDCATAPNGVLRATTDRMYPPNVALGLLQPAARCPQVPESLPQQPSDPGQVADVPRGDLAAN